MTATCSAPSVDPLLASCVRPATQPMSHGGREFTPAQLALVGAAIDAGLHYDRDVLAASREPWRALLPVVDTCLTANNGRPWVDAPPERAAANAQLAGYEEVLKSCRRGAWALIRGTSARDPARATWRAVIAIGEGAVFWPSITHLGREPRHEDLVELMVAMDIYLAYGAEVDRRKREVQLLAAATGQA